MKDTIKVGQKVVVNNVEGIVTEFRGRFVRVKFSPVVLKDNGILVDRDKIELARS